MTALETFYVGLATFAIFGLILLLALWDQHNHAKRVSTITPPEAAPVTSSIDAGTLLMLCSFLYFHAANGQTKRETDAKRNGNERDISAGRRAEIKQMLDTERRYIPPDKWMTKTRFRSIVGGDSTKSGQLYDDLQRELDMVEVAQLNAALTTS